MSSYYSNALMNKYYTGFLLVRFLENDFILVRARLLVPCAYLSRKVPYKYIVLKEKRRDSKEKAKYLWDHLVGWGVYKNRCLQVPKERCQSGGAFYFYLLILVFGCVSLLLDIE